MSRDPYRSPVADRWDRERFMSERERERYPDERARYDADEDDRVYTRGNAGPSRRRDLSADDRYERRVGSASGRAYDDEVVIRDSRRVYHDDYKPRYTRQRSPSSELERDRHVVIERERERVVSPSPPRRPGFMRRQSSLDTFDRRPKGYYEREEYGPPARREDYRPQPYVPIPLPRSRALPPPRRYAERDYLDEIRVSDPDHFGDDDFRAPERVREKEIIRTRRREHSPSSRTSRTSRTRSHHGSSVRSSSRSSTVTSVSSSSSGGTTMTVKSEYPKKGKTRIPGRLVSKRALIDLGYPFVEEGNTIVVLKALGQENIDDMLKLSEDYKKSELEIVSGTRTEVSGLIEERREETVVMAPPPSMSAPPPPVMHHPPPVMHHPPPVMHHPPPSMHHPPPVMHHPPSAMHAPPPPPPAPVEVVNTTTTVVRDVSPARSYTTTTSGTTHTSHTSHSTARTPVVVDVRREEYSEEVPVGPLALVTSDRHRSRSRSGRDLRSEIKDLERQLEHRRRHERGDIVKAERLSSGELVLYEEKVERIEEPRRGVRIEKDKKGRMSISVPKNR